MFLGEGSSKARLISPKPRLNKNLTSPGTFLASEEPTNHVGARHFFFECPLFRQDFIRIPSAGGCQKGAGSRDCTGEVSPNPTPPPPGAQGAPGRSPARAGQRNTRNPGPEKPTGAQKSLWPASNVNLDSSSKRQTRSQARCTSSLQACPQ